MAELEPRRIRHPELIERAALLRVGKLRDRPQCGIVPADVVGPQEQLGQKLAKRSAGLDRHRPAVRSARRRGGGPLEAAIEKGAGRVMEHLRAGRLAVPRVARDVWRAQRDRPDQGGIRLRLTFPDIEHRPAQAFLLKATQQRGVVNDRAAGGIDDGRVRPEQREPGRIKQVSSRVRAFPDERHVTGHNVAPFQQVLQRDQAGLPGSLQGRIVGQHGHSQRLGLIPHQGPDAAQADDPQRPPGASLLPQRDKRRDDVFRHRVCIAARRVRQHDPARPQPGLIHMVQADRRAADEPDAAALQ